MKKATLQVSSGFGIRNVNERIALWYHGGSGLIFRNEEDGSLTVRIILDITQEKRNPDKAVCPGKAGGKAENEKGNCNQRRCIPTQPLSSMCLRRSLKYRRM